MEVSYDTESSSVFISGSFNGWGRQAMHRSTPNHYTYTLTTRQSYPEKVVFKFIVDGAWVTSPRYDSEYDAAGNQNNFVFVKPARLLGAGEPLAACGADACGLPHPATRVAPLLPDAVCRCCGSPYDAEALEALPVLLSCNHTICRACMGKGRAGSCIVCPLCQRECKVRAAIDWKVLRRMLRASVFAEQRKYYAGLAARAAAAGHALPSVPQQPPTPSSPLSSSSPPPQEPFVTGSVASHMLAAPPGSSLPAALTDIDPAVTCVGERNRALLATACSSDVEMGCESDSDGDGDGGGDGDGAADGKGEGRRIANVAIPEEYCVSPLEFSVSPLELDVSPASSPDMDAAVPAGTPLPAAPYWTFEFCEVYPEFCARWKRENGADAGGAVLPPFGGASALPFQGGAVFECRDLGVTLGGAGEGAGGAGWCAEHEAPCQHFCYDDLVPVCVHCVSSTHCGHLVAKLPDAEQTVRRCLLRRLHPLKRADEELARQALFYECVLSNLRLIEDEQRAAVDRYYDTLPRRYQPLRERDLGAVGFQSRGPFFKNRLRELAVASRLVADFDAFLARRFLDAQAGARDPPARQAAAIAFMVDAIREYGRKLDDTLRACRKQLDAPYPKMPIAVRFVPPEHFVPDCGQNPPTRVLPVEHKAPGANYERLLAFAGNSPTLLADELELSDSDSDSDSDEDAMRGGSTALAGVEVADRRARSDTEMGECGDSTESSDDDNSSDEDDDDTPIHERVWRILVGYSDGTTPSPSNERDTRISPHPFPPRLPSSVPPSLIVLSTTSRLQTLLCFWHTSHSLFSRRGARPTRRGPASRRRHARKQHLLHVADGLVFPALDTEPPPVNGTSRPCTAPHSFSDRPFARGGEERFFARRFLVC